MTLKIEFETDNAAFGDDATTKAIAAMAILCEIGERLMRAELSGSIHDTNGNQIGRYELTEA